MTGQFQWIDDRPKPHKTPLYANWQYDHDQHPIHQHAGRVPGVRRPRRVHAKIDRGAEHD